MREHWGGFRLEQDGRNVPEKKEPTNVMFLQQVGAWKNGEGLNSWLVLICYYFSLQLGHIDIMISPALSHWSYWVIIFE